MKEIFPSIESLVPHRGALLLLDELTGFDGQSLTAACRVSADAWYAEPNGAMPAWIGIELMAQAVAAHNTLSSRGRGEPPKKGVLLGTRTYQCSVPRFAACDRLRVIASAIYLEESGLGAYECIIIRDGERLATATLTVYKPDDFEAFVKGGQS